MKRHPLRRHNLISIILLLGFAISVRGQEKLDLRLRLHKGDVHSMRVTLQQTIDPTVQGNKQRTIQTILLSYRFEVQDLDSQDVATVAITYTSAEFHLKSPTAEVNYDSTQPSSPVPPGGGPLASMIGQSFAARVSPTGRIDGVDGLDALLKAALAHLNLPEGPSRTAAEKRLAQQLSEPIVRSLLQMTFAPLSDHPVAVGESWYRKESLSFSFPLTLETTYTLKGNDNGIATIEMAGRSTSVPNAMIDAGQLKMTYDLHGDLHGQIRLDQSTGWPIDSTTTQSLAGGVAFHLPGAQVQVVPLTVESTMKVEEGKKID